MSEFIGQGHGGLLLDHAIETASSWDAARLWRHACTDDHPNALNDDRKSGLSIFKVEGESADQSDVDEG